MRSCLLAAPAFGWLVLTACDPHMHLEVQLTLPVAYMQSLDYPVQFAFETDQHRGASQTLCGAQDQEYAITLTDDAIACAEPLEVRVAEGPWNAPSTGCVTEAGNTYQVLMDNGGTQIATDTAFGDYSADHCESASDTVQITLGQ